MSFLEARKIEASYLGENSYVSIAPSEDRTNEDNKYRTLVKKLIQLETKDGPKFQENQKKKLHSAEF